MSFDITCKKTVDLISKKEEGRLTKLQRFQLWKHLTVCSLCKRFSHQNKMFGKAIRFNDNREMNQADRQSIIDAVLGKSTTNL